MSIKEVRVCDGCGEIINAGEKVYHLVLQSNEFWDGTETDYLQKHLDFCERCAENIKEALEKIAAKKGVEME